jgi:lipid-A-disaccharide synthase
MKVLLLSGEESGNIYADMIRDRLAGHEIRGYADYGFSTAELAVMGFWPVLKRLPFFLKVASVMKRVIDEWRPDVVLSVDYPGLNLKLAAYAKQKGIGAVHVVCPQVWAWKRGRVPKIERSLDCLCCFFPFEARYFTPGFARFVGHPLAERFSISKTTPDERMLAILPGSRIGEIEKILPVQLEAFRLLGNDIEGLKAVIPAANTKARQAIEKIIARFPRDMKLEVCDGAAREVLGRSLCATVASGTATLEAALANCPTVLVYKVGRFLAWFAKMVIKDIRHVGLANVVAEKAGAECPMPELLQENFTAAALVETLRPWFNDEESRKLAKEKLADTMKLLQSDGDSIGRIVKCIEEFSKAREISKF